MPSLVGSEMCIRDSLVILRGGIDADRPQPRDRRPLVEEVAAQDAAAAFRDHPVDTRMVDEIPDRLGRRRDRRKVGRESVARRERRERLVADAPCLLYTSDAADDLLC